MQSALVLVLLAMAPGRASSIRGVSGASRLQPQIVATTLVKMEDEWRSQAELFAECNATLTGSGKNCMSAFHAFEKSCGTVVQAVQRASSGDRTVVTDYMGDVCGQPSLQGWRKERCQSLASTIAGAMSADNYENRESLDIAGLCKTYWSSFAESEKALVIKQHAEAEAKRVALQAEEKKLADEKKAADAKAAAKQAEQDKRRQVEEAALKKVEDAKLKIEEEKIAAKQALALRKAQEAKHRMDAAKADEEVARLKKEAFAARRQNTGLDVAKATTAKVANATKPSQNSTAVTHVANATVAVKK